MDQFYNKTAIITGAASGIGKALAKLAVQYGMKVILIDQNQQGLNDLAKELHLNQNFLSHPMDVRDKDAWASLAQTATEIFGSIHYLFNNAGVGGPMNVAWDVHHEVLKWVMDVNFYGPIHGIQAFLPYFFQQQERARIVNIASMAGLYTAPYLSAYEASKHALISWTESLYLDLKQQNKPVDISIVAPGWVQTAILDNCKNAPEDYLETNFDLYTEKDVEWILAFARNVKRGLPPSIIGERIFSGILKNDFYIFTHPEMKPLISKRMQGILNQQDPTQWSLNPIDNHFNKEV